MKKIGLIGGSGCGKSTVASLFTEYGLGHIDCDQVARQVVEPGMPCLAELVDYFGADILQADGRLNRPQLARIAFSSQDQTQALNRITHKYILSYTDRLIEEMIDKPGVIIDAAALAESGYLETCDHVIAVVAPKYKRLRRIMRRDNIHWIAARRRLRAQKKDAFYRSFADYVIYNNKGLDHVKKQVKTIFDDIFINHKEDKS